jgi:hypothetical protein
VQGYPHVVEDAAQLLVAPGRRLANGADANARRAPPVVTGIVPLHYASSHTHDERMSFPDIQCFSKPAPLSK